MLLQPRTILLPWRVLRAVLVRWRQRQLVRRGWYDTSVRSETPAIFIGGCPRSGTTLLREILSRHTALGAGVESGLLVPPFNHRRVADLWGVKTSRIRRLVNDSTSMVDFADTMYGDLMKQLGKRRWVEKSTTNVTVIDRLLTWFPEATFIHMIRDGRDVVCSLRHHPKEEMVRGRLRPVTRTNPIDVCAHWWLQYAARGLAFHDHPRVVEIRYEQLVTRPEATVRELCARIGEVYESTMLEPDAAPAEQRPPAWYTNSRNASRPICTTSIGRWTSELGQSERRRFVDVAGELLLTLGYVQDHSWVNQPPASRAAGDTAN